MESTSDGQPTAEEWLHHEDQTCRQDRLARLRWMSSIAPSSEIWLFPGSHLSVYLFEEARYCFVYGQFLAAIILGMAYIERSLAAWLYASGRNDLKRATFRKLLEEAQAVGWLTTPEHAALERVRQLRNPLAHFRAFGHPETVERRAIDESVNAYELIERDAREVLAAVMAMLKRHAI